MSKALKKVSPFRKGALSLFPGSALPNPVSYTIFTTPDDAQEILDKMMPDFQRHTNDDAIKYLANEMLHGRFETTTVIFGALREEGENKFLNIDGRTRLSAIVLSGKSQWLSYLFNPYASLDLLRRAYGRIDRQRARTFKDWLRANAVLDTVDLYRPIENKIHGIAQTLLLDFKVGRSAYRGDAKVYDVQEKKVTELLPSIFIYSEIVRAGRASQRKYFENIAIASVSIYLINKYGNPAIEFVSRMIHDDGIKAESHEKVLLEKIKDMREEGTSNIAEARRVRAFEYVWNKFCDETKVKNVFIKDHTLPVSFNKPSVL